MYEIAIPYLDECSAVYLPACGPQGQCVRLNASASALWRQLAATGDLMPDRPEHSSFLTLMLERRAIRRLA